MGIPSTIVDLTGDTPRLVRQGAIDFPSPPGYLCRLAGVVLGEMKPLPGTE